MINKKEIILHGLKRSGHHAVANWIYRQSPDHKCYINDVKLDRNPFLTRNAYSNIGDRKREAKGEFSKKDLLMYTFEDKDITKVYSSYFTENREAFVGDSGETYNVIVLRDPFNHIASRLKSLRKGCNWAWVDGETEESSTHYIDLWKKQAKEFLGDTSYTPGIKICIDFNKWMCDKEYRKNTIENIGIDFTDEGKEEVVKAGGGSAFSGRKFDGKASKMDVNSRWELFSDDPYYLSIFDKESLKLADRIWGKEVFKTLQSKIKENNYKAPKIEITHAPQKVKSIAIDLKNANIFKDKPTHVPGVLLGIAHHLQKKGTKINICLLKNSRKAIKNFKKTHEFNYSEIDGDCDVDKTFSDIDFYLGFFGNKHRKKRMHFKKKKKPLLVYETGGIYNSLLIDPSGIFGEATFPKKLGKLLENYPINNIEEYCKNSVINDISKRTQNGSDTIPDEDFIFIPGQAIHDTSITACSRVGLLEFIDKVSTFAKNNNILVVFKPHPGLYDSSARHGSKKQIDFCKNYDNVRIVNNSIHKICKKALFVATVNTAAIDCFINQSPVYCCGSSYFMNTNAIIYNPNVEEGLQTMLDSNYDKNIMMNRQLKTVAWVTDNWLLESLSAEENIKRIEKMANIIF